MRREPAEVIEAARTLDVLNETELGAIKKKFRKLAIEFHPDRSKDKNAAMKFKAFSEAYGVITEYHKDGGKFPISSLVLSNQNSRSGPSAKSASRTTVWMDQGQNVKAWVHESYTEGSASNFWEALNNMFNPQVFNGMNKMMGGMGRVMGNFMEGPLATIHGRLRDVLGIVGNEKKFDTGTLREIVEIISGGDESGRAAIGYIDGLKDIRKGIQQIAKTNKKKSKKKTQPRKKKGATQTKAAAPPPPPPPPAEPEIPIFTAGRKKAPDRPVGRFIVMPLALVRYKEASDDGKNPHPLWGELIAGDGSSQWGTFKVLMEDDIAIIDGAKYTVECKVS